MTKIKCYNFNNMSHYAQKFPVNHKIEIKGEDANLHVKIATKVSQLNDYG